MSENRTPTERVAYAIGSVLACITILTITALAAAACWAAVAWAWGVAA